MEKIDEIIEGMEKTHRAGTRYPIPYQISTPEFFVKMKKQLDKVKKIFSNFHKSSYHKYV